MNGEDVYFTDQFISFNKPNIGIYVFANSHNDINFGLTKSPILPFILTILIYYIEICNL